MINRLSSPIESMKQKYTVVVVGSGYGGAIAASRLARAGQSVCLLERGKERLPGEFPNTLAETALQMQVNGPEHHEGSRTALFDFRVGDDISVLVGCGLGGTSLINASVSIRPSARVFAREPWPAELQDPDALERGYALAEAMLSPNPYPKNFPTLPKLVALENSAKAMGEKFYRTNINVSFKDGINAAGVEQKQCTLCGDCVSGCNYAAKNTTQMNYLPDAKRHGAEIFTETSVRYLEQGPNGSWLVHYQALGTGRESFEAPTLFVMADIVILAAGTLGSTEILLRSREKGLSLSGRLGDRFSGNGDFLGFGYNCAPAIDGVGLGHHAPGTYPPSGPTITGVIDMRRPPDIENDIIIEEGAIPGGVSTFLPAFFRVGKRLGDVNTAPETFLAQEAREFESRLLGSYHGAVKHTITYLVMGQDGEHGTLSLTTNDRLSINWPGAGKQPLYQMMREKLIDATKPLQGIQVNDPTWSELFGRQLVSVHPLGGCALGERAEAGVVDHASRIFAGQAGTETHRGLYVMDGSIIPTALGVNPLLTISALTERACAILAEERGWTIDYSYQGPIPPSPPQKPGIRFTESMKGFFSATSGDDYEAAYKKGEEEGNSFVFVLTIASEDAEDMIHNPSHEARMVGTVTAPTLAADPLSVTDGVFNLFVTDPSRADTRLMKYNMRMVSEAGKIFHMSGFKVITERPFWDVWHDSTTLYTTIREGSEAGPVIGKGILRISVADFIRQLFSMEATNTTSEAERARTLSRFGRYFAGVLFDYYGGLAAPLEFDDPKAAPRKKRPLRVPDPGFYPFKANDGTELLLTRYQGGSKGPVLLAHGLGVSSRIFSTDLIETNLLEYLTAHQYDVWLLDFRSSIALAASRSQYTADDVVMKDWPAAIAQVRAQTKANDVQVVAHCYGALTFSMALLAGLRGVRSAVLSQVSAHLECPALADIKAGLHTPNLLETLGVSSLNADAKKGEGFFARLYDKALTLYPIDGDERCSSAVCHRISFMYGLLYEHAQLNHATHESLHELFGEATIGAFEGLAQMIRAGHVLRADGSNAYLPNLRNMSLPLLFLHGSENGCFLPESTEKTFDALSAKNGAQWYTRRVVQGYGHIDGIIGKDAVKDVYPLIVEHLDAHNPKP